MYELNDKTAEDDLASDAARGVDVKVLLDQHLERSRNEVTDDYPGTRDFAVIDTGHADVTAIVATFNADFAHKAIRPPDGTDLAWSPTNSQSSIGDRRRDRGRLHQRVARSVFDTPACWEMFLV
jgi:hypothetical protein